MLRLSIMGASGHRELSALEVPGVEVKSADEIQAEFDRLIAAGYQAFVTEVEGAAAIPVRTHQIAGVRRAIEHPGPDSFDVTMFPNGAGG